MRTILYGVVFLLAIPVCAFGQYDLGWSTAYPVDPGGWTTTILTVPKWDGDINGDSCADFMRRDDDGFQGYSGKTGQRFWLFNPDPGMGAWRYLAWAQTDDDADPEFIMVHHDIDYNKDTIRIINWRTNDVEWSYGAVSPPANFYISDLDDDGREEILIDDAGQLKCYGYGDPSGVSDDSNAPSIPDAIELRQNRPNPFNPNTVIDYELPKAAVVSLEIFNVQGQLVRVIIDGRQPAGTHSAVWDGRDEGGAAVASGVYFYSLRTPDGMTARKMVLLK